MADEHLEIIELGENREGWRVARLALNGQLACPLDIAEERFRFYKAQGDKALLNYLKSQARVAINAFGDFRNIRRRENGDFVRLDDEQEGG